MDADEREIFHYLKASGSQFVAAKEICRRAGSRKRYGDDPDWAKIVLLRMEERGILESDVSGRYRIKAARKKKGEHQWVSPEISKILSEGGVKADEAGGEGGGEAGELHSDEHYDQL